MMLTALELSFLDYCALDDFRFFLAKEENYRDPAIQEKVANDVGFDISSLSEDELEEICRGIELGVY